MAMRSGAPENITAALGPTNTGKTHLAVERMLAYGSGMIGLPLRLLAREIYDRVVAAKGASLAALITGEEKIVPRTARYFICTVESMPMTRQVDFVAIDEVQLGADRERGHVFTDRMLYARGSQETMLLGSDTMSGMIRSLVPDAEHVERERFSQLSYTGPAKLTRLPRRSAIVAFSSESVYAIAELMRRRRGGAAVVMGGLSPRTRNAQVELYQSGEVDFMVATDAIGMGLNMEIEHVAFAESRKFDGLKHRRLTAAELGQIAGRAGRFRTDGTFGETAECLEFDPDIVSAVENHSFAPVERLQWRNPDLDTSSIDRLRYTLNKPAYNPALERVREASDERALNILAEDSEIADRARSPGLVARLWDVCRLPDFRKATIDAHARLVKSIYMHLSDGNGRLPNSWMQAQFDRLDKTAGDVDALASRLTFVRTWAYAAHRADWTEKPEHWRERARLVEDRLSDALHERLMQRFVDRRTQALVKGLRDDKHLLAGVSAAGEVTVEGHYVGRLKGLTFEPDAQGKDLSARALRSAVLRALRPEMDRRLSELTNSIAVNLSIEEDGHLKSGEDVIGKLVAGADLLQPAIKSLGGELGSAENQAAAKAALRDAVDMKVRETLKPLFDLRGASDRNDIPGPARGVAWQLYEAGGAIVRSEISDDIAALDQDARRSLRQLGVRIGQHMIYMPMLVKPAPSRLFALLRGVFNGEVDLSWLPAPGLTSVANDRAHSRADYAAVGFYPCGSRAVRFDMLERLADEIREARKTMEKGRFPLTANIMALMGCSVEDARGVLSALGYKRYQKGPDPEKAEGEIWGSKPGRRPAGAAPKKQARPAPAAAPMDPDNPFAALAALKPVEEPKKPAKKKKRRKPKKTETATTQETAQQVEDATVQAAPAAEVATGMATEIQAQPATDTTAQPNEAVVADTPSAQE